MACVGMQDHAKRLGTWFENVEMVQQRISGDGGRARDKSCHQQQSAICGYCSPYLRDPET
jgi:hypothetical protein